MAEKTGTEQGAHDDDRELISKRMGPAEFVQIPKQYCHVSDLNPSVHQLSVSGRIIVRQPPQVHLELPHFTRLDLDILDAISVVLLRDIGFISPPPENAYNAYSLNARPKGKGPVLAEITRRSPKSCRRLARSPAPATRGDLTYILRGSLKVNMNGGQFAVIDVHECFSIAVSPAQAPRPYTYIRHMATRASYVLPGETAITKWGSGLIVQTD
ncbi:hypothetical protein SODALDRAFT_357882 [Sodiomyces alkalinus F11]|uniref:Uncharacterized protein n=1 Tax=Sodiomyces alkalinus (strain CBS 110278 / VKM F-3762 / F11) TaxID=1314773 RepID=A0A3N2PY62_SODAK|nr:hypothetical protein SODALDRAFT_357882 [Sodiomyces alkalinus F11]ROT39479.1 hypothetical protein SODALDRAFT_357882 [Sodiomyces alkalinus F11]